jgi:PAS domain S-box-containing protein
MNQYRMKQSAPFGSFFDAVSVGLAAIDIGSGKFVRVNPAFCTICGYSDVELLNGMTFIDITLEDDRQLNLESHRQLLAGTIDSYTIEKRYRRKDGTVVCVRVWSAIERDPIGGDDRIAAVITDITHEKRLEDRLLVAQQVAQIGTWDWDIASNIANCSKSYFGLYGLPPDSQPPSYEEWLSCIHPDDRARVAGSMQRASAGNAYTDEFRVVWPDGTIRWLAARGILECDAGGTPIRMVGANIDITAQKQREDELHSLRREMAHRMANSLALISSSLRLQRSKSTDEAKILDSVARRINAVSHIQQRLDYTSVQDEIDIDRYLAAVCNDLRLAFFESDRRTFIVMATSGLQLSRDRAVAIGLIATELVLNALKYAHDEEQSGNIFVAFTSEGRGFRLVVGDDGIGLNAEFVPEASSGMGMEIIKSQVKRIGGRLEIDRAPPGVRFVICAAA